MMDEAKIGGITPGSIDLQGDMRVLTAINPPSHNSFGILNGNAPLAPFHINNKGHHHYHHDQEKQNDKNAHLAGLQQAHGVHEGVGNSCNNTGKNDKRNAIADSAFSDLFAEPHDEGGAGGEGDNRDEPEPHPAWMTTISPPGAVMPSTPTAIPKPWMILEQPCHSGYTG